jgi:hypothetical protein
MKLHEMTGAWYIQSEAGETIKIGELLIEPHFHMLLYVHYERGKPRGFALFEPTTDARPEAVSHHDFIITNAGHYDTHEDCEMDWEELCRIACAKKLDLSIFIIALQFDHPLAQTEPLDPDFIPHPDSYLSDESYSNILSEIQLGQ